MICKRCESELPDNSRFCLTCGALQPMVCPSCQAESRPGSRTCTGCGKKLPVSGNGIKFYKKKKTPTEIAATVLLVLGALLVLTAAVLFLIHTINDMSDKGEEDLPPVVVEEAVDKEAGKVPDVKVETPVVVTPPDETKDPVEDEPNEDEPNEEDPEEKDPSEEDPDEKDPEEEPEEDPNREWVFPDSSERLLTEADIAGMDKATLRIARNEIYARHGYIFGSADLKEYFGNCSWYKGTLTKAQFNEETIFNDIEQANVNFLKNAEK